MINRYNDNIPLRRNLKTMSLQDTHPDLASKWHPTKNGELSVLSVSHGSEKKVYWYCSLHEQVWELEVYKMAKNPSRGCLNCLHRLNSLQVGYPELAKQFHPVRNGLLTPAQISKSSEKLIWWLCSAGHEWEKSPYSRLGGGRIRGCPFCSPRKPENVLLNKSLFTAHPDVASLWHPTMNGDLTAQQVTKGSARIVWWQGSCNHEWENRIAHQVTATVCPYCFGKRLLEGVNSLTQTQPDLAKQWHPTKNEGLLPDNFTYGSDVSVWWKCANNHEWKAKIAHRSAGTGCSTCITPHSSYEDELAEFFDVSKIPHKSNIRSVIPPYELDLYFPNKAIAIEFNGIYWHSEANGKDKNYHYNKWLACKEQGIQLIQIWEDDWKINPNLIKNMLLHKLGESVQDKVFARKTSVQLISFSEAQVFLEANHIQGSVRGAYYTALMQEDVVIAVMVLNVKKEEAFIDRYATSVNVVGGFTKLLAYAEKILKANHPDVQNLVTFADNEISNGNLYSMNGFVVDKELPPDYKYVYQAKRHHKFGFRKKRFEKDDKLQFIAGMTEKELAVLNKVHRTWDSGKTRYGKDLSLNKL